VFNNNNYLKAYEQPKHERPMTGINQAGYHINKDYESISLDVETEKQIDQQQVHDMTETSVAGTEIFNKIDKVILKK
jgi:hypothetical protein